MPTLHAFINKYKDRHGHSYVVIEYTHMKSRWRFNTGIKINPDEVVCLFDSDLETYKLAGRIKLSDSKKVKLIYHSRTLDDQFMKMKKSVSELISRRLPPTPDLLKKIHLTAPNQPHATNKTLFQWYEQFIRTKELEIGSGINGYRSTFEHFRSFSHNKGILVFSDLGKSFLEGFRDYLTKKNLGGPTIHKQFRNLKIFINWVQGEDESGTISVPSAIKKMKIKARYGDPVGLSPDQFFELYHLDLKERKQLEITRDLFVFAVSMGGPRHGDLKRLAEILNRNGYNLTDNSITYFEAKTGNAHQEVILNSLGLEILQKYHNVIPHVPSNFRMNKNLKTIAYLLNWNEIKYIPAYDNFGKLSHVNELALKDIFSTKFMRKTAATIDNLLGVPTKTSMKTTGHKTFAAYSRYVDVNKDSLQQANHKWDDFVKKTQEAAIESVMTLSMEDLRFAA